MLLKNQKPASGNANGVLAGNAVNLPALGAARIKCGSLSLDLNADVETSTLTFTVAWEGCDTADFASPIALANNEVNAAAAVVGTGTAGADANIVKSYSAPPSAYAFRYVRAKIVVGVATGTTSDTYATSYRYRV